MPANNSTAVATQRGSHFLPNATGFEIGGGQFILGDVHNHHTGPSPQPNTSISSTILDEVFSESEVYCRQMLRQKRGFPLYEPAPQSNLPPEYKRHGVSIGDVGSVTPEGIFDFFFNIFLPSEHPINANDTPADFSPMSPYFPKDVVQLQYDPGYHVSTSTVRRLDLDDPSDQFPGGRFVFSCGGMQGAVLALPYGSDLQKLRNIENVRAYATKHAASWYKYINGPRGRGLANGELYLVTGYEKVQSWGMASYYANNEEFVLAFKPTVSPDTNQYRWSGNPGQKNPSRKKSYDHPRTNGDPLNHTTFVHGLSISLGTGLWSRLVGTVPVETSSIADFQSRLKTTGGSYVAGSQGSSYLWSWSLFSAGSATGGKRSAQQSAEVVLSHVSPNAKVCNPGKLINEYIQHTVPNATIIMSHDDDWSDILGDQSEIASPAEFFQRVDDQFAIAEQDGATFLVPKSPSTESPLTIISTWDNIDVGEDFLEEFNAAAGEASSSAQPRKRGRPPKEKKDYDKDTEDDGGDGDDEPTPKRKPGHPPKPALPADPNPTPKTRGRPPKKPVENPAGEEA